MDNSCEEFSKRFNKALDLREYPSLGRGRINYIQEIFGISRAGANKWLHGKAIPHPRKRAEIAEKLNISLRWLETGEGSLHEIESNRFTSGQFVHAIPVLTLQQAYDYQNNINNSETEQLIVNQTVPKNSFAVTCVGSAMVPKFSEGMTLIVQVDAKIQDGDYVLARTPAFPETIIRQYIKGSASIYLTATNPKFEHISADDSVVIIGKIIEMRNKV